MTDYKTIQLSAETYEELSRLKTSIQKIFGSSISFDKAIRFLIMAKIDWIELLALIGEDD